MKDTTPTKGQLRAALESVIKHLGEMPKDWPSEDLFRAYSAAHDLLNPDEFTQRFMEKNG